MQYSNTTIRMTALPTEQSVPHQKSDLSTIYSSRTSERSEWFNNPNCFCIHSLPLCWLSFLDNLELTEGKVERLGSWRPGVLWSQVEREREREKRRRRKVDQTSLVHQPIHPYCLLIVVSVPTLTVLDDEWISY